jgi:hypothetical protein
MRELRRTVRNFYSTAHMVLLRVRNGSAAASDFADETQALVVAPGCDAFVIADSKSRSGQILLPACPGRANEKTDRWVRAEAAPLPP